MNNYKMPVPGYLDEKSRKKLWEIELRLLESFKTICEKYELDWFLIGGSAIGAVRHGGFIPWDDDIDIGMHRKDFEKFVEVAKKELPEDMYLQYGLSEDEQEFYYFCRVRDKNSTGIIREEAIQNSGGVQGVFIELYPFDTVSEKKSIRTIQWKISMILIELIRKRVYKVRVGKKAEIAHIFLKWTSVKQLYDWWYKVCTWYNKKYCTLVDTVSLPGYSQSEVDLYDIKDVISSIEVPYENTTARIPVGNDKCLRKTYGDYMQLPSEEERGRHHDAVVFYDPYVPYTQYLKTDILHDFFEIS